MRAVITIFLPALWQELSFLFAWARMAVITTGSIALLAFGSSIIVRGFIPLGSIRPRFTPP